MTDRVARLVSINADQREQILNAPRTSEAHRALLDRLPCMNAVQLGGQPGKERLPASFHVVAWNVERCLFPEDSANQLSHLHPQIVLLSEVDYGMARTKQRNTTEDMAAALGMTYAFGVEFFEMALGGDTEQEFCEDSFNAEGWHGNAVLSTVPFEKTALFRLDRDGHWFTPETGADTDQPRVGGRMAIAAIVPGESGPICVVSTHLESNADNTHRAAQFDDLMDLVDSFAPDMPVLIGGDLNTGNHMPPDFDWRKETLFQRAKERGYDWSFTAPGTTTRPSLITRHPDRKMKLDWICAKGMSCHDRGIVPSIDPNGRPLSDHDAVYARVSC